MKTSIMRYLKLSIKKGDYIKLDNIFYEISPFILNKKLPLFKSYIESKIEKNEKVMDFIKDHTEHAISRRNELIEKNEKLKKLLKSF